MYFLTRKERIDEVVASTVCNGIPLGSPRCHAADVAGKTSKSSAIIVSEGEITIPTYEQVGRYMQPPLFNDSTMTGLYPFTTFKRQFKEGSPFPEKYQAIFVDNGYFKLTYIPELGGRFFSVYDKAPSSANVLSERCDQADPVQSALYLASVWH